MGKIVTNPGNVAELNNKFILNGRYASEDISNCSTIEAVYNFLKENGPAYCALGSNASSNFKTLVGDPDIGTGNCRGSAYIEMENDTYTYIRVVATWRTKGLKYKYLIRHSQAETNSFQTEWVTVVVA